MTLNRCSLFLCTCSLGTYVMIKQCVTPRFSVRPAWRIRTEFGVRDHVLGFLPDFFFLKNRTGTCGLWPTSYNIIKILYTFTESHLQLQNYTFTITNQSTEPTCSEPLQVCWPSSIAEVFRCLLLYLHELKTRAKLYA